MRHHCILSFRRMLSRRSSTASLTGKRRSTPLHPYRQEWCSQASMRLMICNRLALLTCLEHACLCFLPICGLSPFLPSAYYTYDKTWCLCWSWFDAGSIWVCVRAQQGWRRHGCKWQREFVGQVTLMYLHRHQHLKLCLAHWLIFQALQAFCKWCACRMHQYWVGRAGCTWLCCTCLRIPLLPCGEGNC